MIISCFPGLYIEYRDKIYYHVGRFQGNSTFLGASHRIHQCMNLISSQLNERSLSGLHGVWFDSSTIQDIANQSLLKKAYPKGTPRTGDCKGYANALGRLTVYDVVFLDTVGATSQRIEIPKELPFILPVELTQEFYTQAGKAVSTAFGLDTIGVASSLLQSAYTEWWWDGTDKQVFDWMAKRNPLFGTSLLCDSQNSHARVLFYLELARSTGKSILLSPSKNKLLHCIQEALPKDVLDHLERIADEMFDSWKLSEDGAPSILDVDIGPVGSYILKVAEINGCSPLDAVMEVRNDPDCIAFRKQLANFESAIKNGRCASRELQSMKTELQSIATLWRDKPSIHGRAINRTLQITALPYIGGLLRLAGMSELKAKDLDLYRQPNSWYFVAKWYSMVSDDGKILES